MKIKEKDGEIVTLQQSNTSYSRIDRIVARLSIEDRKIDLAVLTGTPATNPVAPALTRNSNIYEIALANVLVGKNVSVITQANITDTRLNNSVCGMVAAVIDQLDTSTLFNQYETWFNEKMNEADSDYQQWFDDSEQSFTEWFDRMKDLLTEDAAGNLQIEIDNLLGRITTNENDIGNLQDKVFNIGLGESIVKCIVGKDINSIDLNGFAYLGNCKYGGTSIKNGYLWQIIYTDKYKVQFFASSEDGVGLQCRKLINGKWSDWIVALNTFGGEVIGQLATRLIVPSRDNVYDLGSAGALWRLLYVHQIITPNFKLYSSSSSAVMGVGVEFTVRHQDNINMYMPMSASAFNVNSSRRYKKNIREMTEDEAKKVDDIDVVMFDYINEENGTNVAGAIAEDVYEILPGTVTLKEVDEEKVPDSIDYSKFVPYLIKRVQMLEKRVTELESGYGK